MKIEIGFEGRPTEDGRTIASGAFYWEDLPLPVFMLEGFRDMAYDTRRVVGRITELERTGDTIIATLDVDIPPDYVVSIDGADAVVDTVELEDGTFEWFFTSMKIVGGTLIARESWAWE